MKGRGKEGIGKAQYHYEGTLVTKHIQFIQFTNKQIDKPINLQLYRCKIYQDFYFIGKKHIIFKLPIIVVS